MASAVRNKIAFLEAHNQGIRTDSPSSRDTPTASTVSATREDSPRSRGSNEGMTTQQPSTPEKSTSTAVASQSRISRMRQQQMERDGKGQHATNLKEKRKQIKERRMMQQKRAEVAATTSSTSDVNSSGKNSKPSHIDLARRTEYPVGLPAGSSQSTNRLNNYPGSGTRVVTPTPDEGVLSTESIQYEDVSGPTNEESRAHTKSHSRNCMSKMQRMQKMKGYDHVKRSKHSRHRTSQVSTASAGTPSVVTSTVATSASTTVAHNTRKFRRKKENHSYDTTNTGSTAVSNTVLASRSSSPPVSPSSDGGLRMNSNDVALSASVNDNSFSHLHASSPRSGTDIFSESNYTTGPMDASVEPVTDDEVTLTSVRRIMASDNPGSPGSQSHQYQQLQTRSHRRDETNRNGKGLHEASNGLTSFDSRNGHDVDPRNAYRENRHNLDWLDEEKSDKEGVSSGVFRTASSSDYDTDGDISKTSKTSRQSNTLEGPSQSQATDVNEFFTRSRYSQANRRMDDDDRTFDYGDRDDDSNGSASYAARRRKEAERRSREATVAVDGKNPALSPELNATGESPLINKDDVEHYIKSLDTPAMKLGAGVVGAATVGCIVLGPVGFIVLGPVGLLVGAAAVGIGVGIMQIPEDERNSLQVKAQNTFGELHGKAVEASESLSSSCAATYKDSGVADHLPQCLSGSETVVNDHESARSDKARGPSTEGTSSIKGATKPANVPGTQQEIGNLMVANPNNDRLRNKKVACLRNVRILPAGQIHGLDPAAQPRAWLDVVASANTTDEEKNEAMEEILILAKDKRRARIFLDEGILDFIIWTLGRYFEKRNVNEKDSDWAHPEITPNERAAAKLAAMCCVTLGKAHCAAIHTEGDLLLMSLYERGTVPEERQVAQMLHEVPHHARITKTTDPTIVEPSKEVFALRQLTLPQAEELARSIKAVADGKL